MSTKETILSEYHSKKALYEEFANKLSDLLSQMIKRKGITVNAITCREKDSESLSKKISKEGNEDKYNKLSDITDLAGVRIITYFSDDVDKIASIIEEEFLIDTEKSIDKRKNLDPDRFGYLSLHYIIQLKPNRAQLIEYQPYADLTAEIQVRSILQHAWAEIEHDLGYKSKGAIPKDTRRSFSRLAGMLELTDSEFLRIRNELEEYERAIPAQIIETPASVYVDQVSLNAYINSSPVILETAQKIVMLRPKTTLQTDKKSRVDYTTRLHYLGIETISELDEKLNTNKEKIVKFADLLLSPNPKVSSVFYVGVPIFYLCYVLITETNAERVMEYCEKFNIGKDSEREAFVKRLLEIRHKIC